MGRDRTPPPKKLTAKEIRIQKQADQALRVREEREAAAQNVRNANALSARAKEVRLKAAQSEFINERRVEWNALINPVVAQVLALRAANPNLNGINAGNNKRNGVASTQGGTDSPIALGWPNGAPGNLTKGDALKHLIGFKNSDSALYKVKRNEVLVHLK